MSVANILAVWARVDAIDREEGMLAYPRYHDSLAVYARHYELPLASVVGAFAALSPNNDYLGTLRSLVTLLDGQRDGVPVEALTISTYNACRDRAWDYLHGSDFLTMTAGKKTRAFFRNIMDPSDPEPVTIDGHMVGVSIGQRMNMKAIVRTGFDYDAIAAEFRDVAGQVGVVPCQLQAVIWFTWKRIHNVIFEPQLDAFSMGDQWRSLTTPDMIRPYPRKAIRENAPTT